MNLAAVNESSSLRPSSASGSSAGSHLLRLHHHRWPDRRHHHFVSHSDHHLLHGGHQTQLLRSLLVHASPLHHFLRRSCLSRSRVRRAAFSFLFSCWKVVVFLFLCRKVWPVCLISRRIVRSQNTTVPPHNTTFCKDRPEDWGRTPECPIPQFAGGFPQVWLILHQRTSTTRAVKALPEKC